MTLIFRCLFLALAVSSFTNPVYADITLSVNPIDGGSGIRFERVLPGFRNTKQVQIRVSSDDTQRYQVFQRVYEPIINEKGQSLNLSAVEVAALPNSNTSGTLYMQNVDRLNHSEQLIYTSGQVGASDTFTLAYGAVPELIEGSGIYRGRIVYTARVFGGQQKESIIDFSLDSAPQLKVSVSGGRELKRVRIKDTDGTEKADFVKFSFSDNGSQEIKFYQELVSGLTNEAGNEFPLDVLKVSIQGDGSALRSMDAALSQSRTLIYSGNENQADFAVYFTLDSQMLQKAEAGRYTGKIKYTLEGASSQEFLIDVECEIQPVFTIDIELPPEGVSFGHVLASTPGQEKRVVVTVRSNAHKPYQVLQNMVSLMTNEQGKEFDKKYFTFKVELASDQNGNTRFAEYSSVEVGEYPIYYSDAQGSSAVFTVIYQLRGYFDMSPGNFVAPLKYSLNQN